MSATVIPFPASRIVRQPLLAQVVNAERFYDELLAFSLRLIPLERPASAREDGGDGSVLNAMRQDA